MPSILEVKSLTKCFGALAAVASLCMQVEKGEIAPPAFCIPGLRWQLYSPVLETVLREIGQREFFPFRPL